MEENLEEFVLKNVKMSFLCLKEDKYDNTNSYFRIMDKNFNDRVKPITKDNVKYPWFYNNGKPVKQLNKNIPNYLMKSYKKMKNTLL